MDIKQIQELIKLINKSSIAEITIEENDTKITIKQKKEPAQNYYLGNQQQGVHMHAATQGAPSAPEKPASLPAPPPAEPKVDNLLIIKSPMIGTFYRQSGPDKPVFVNVGDEITVGKVVCMVEAMKLFNEIESEVSGRIVKVLVDDASPVEYDQPLFLVEPI